jgi:hypothetical protein
MAQDHLIEVIESTKPAEAVGARVGMWYCGIVTPPVLFPLAELRGGAPKRIDMCGTEARQNDCPEYGLETRLEEDGKGTATRFKLHELKTSKQLPAAIVAPVASISESPFGLAGSSSRFRG